MAWAHNTDSYSKCIVYFADGNAGTYYSRDWKGKDDQTRDIELGLNRLRRMIRKFGVNAVTAIIYNNTTKERIEQYSKGIRTF